MNFSLKFKGDESLPRRAIPPRPPLNEALITVLYHLVESCQDGELAQEMIRDRLVMGISDKALSEQLCANVDLTLEKAKIMIRQREAIHEQRDMLHISSPNILQLLTNLSQRTLERLVIIQLHRELHLDFEDPQ